jgi:hypothetical protein
VLLHHQFGIRVRRSRVLWSSTWLHTYQTTYNPAHNLEFEQVVLANHDRSGITEGSISLVHSLSPDLSVLSSTNDKLQFSLSYASSRVFE